MSDDLKGLFQAHPAPSPRADLADRIIAAAPSRAANDNPWPRRVAALSAIAATALFAVFALAPAEPAEDDWEQMAEASGFGDLYAWVEGEGES